MSQLEQRLATRRSDGRGWAVQAGGVLNEQASAGPSSPFNPGGKPADPLMMVDMMKKNLTMMVRAPSGCCAGRCWRLRRRCVSMSLGFLKFGFDAGPSLSCPPRYEQVPQFVTYNWVSFFFSGFVVAKVPFALTMRFRQMLQRGVDLQGLDVTYISSLSWYESRPPPRPPPRDAPVAQASTSADRRLRPASRDTMCSVP